MQNILDIKNNVIENIEFIEYSDIDKDNKDTQIIKRSFKYHDAENPAHRWIEEDKDTYYYKLGESALTDDITAVILSHNKANKEEPRKSPGLGTLISNVIEPERFSFDVLRDAIKSTKNANVIVVSSILNEVYGHGFKEEADAAGLDVLVNRRMPDNNTIYILDTNDIKWKVHRYLGVHQDPESDSVICTSEGVLEVKNPDNHAIIRI